MNGLTKMYNELSLQQQMYLERAGILKEDTYPLTYVKMLFEEFLIDEINSFIFA